MMVHCRWMIRNDMKSVINIENLSFEYPWSEREFIQLLRQRDCIGWVAESDGNVVGFMLYELLPKQIRLLSIAVHPDFRRNLIGSEMVAKLISKLNSMRRSNVVCNIRETSLSSQLFFRSLGFRAVKIEKAFYPDSNEDAYVFKFFAHQEENAY